MRCVITFVSAILILPLMLMRDISALEMGSVFGVIINVVAGLVIAWESVGAIVERGRLHPDFRLFRSDVSIGDFGNPLSTYVFSMECESFTNASAVKGVASRRGLDKTRHT